jgi:hypothetical protein
MGGIPLSEGVKRKGNARGDGPVECPPAAGKLDFLGQDNPGDREES